MSNIESMTRGTLMNYLSNYHSPERMVVAGVGIDHEELVEAAQVCIFFHQFKLTVLLQNIRDLFHAIIKSFIISVEVFCG